MINPYPFLSELVENNNRVWFTEHKAEYEAIRQSVIADADCLIAALSEYMPELARFSGAECVYRIYRDVRFSPDKTPYKTHIAMGLSPTGRKMHSAGFYVQIDPTGEFNALWGGIFNPEREMLSKIRRAIDTNAEEWTDIINDPDMLRYFPEWDGRTLKTAPKGYPKDHPLIESLRMLDLGRSHNVSREFFLDPKWYDSAAEMLKTLIPMVNFLNYSINEDV